MIHLLINAIVDTRDESLPLVQALAVKDGCIVEVGGTDEILWLREDPYDLIDLEGRRVVPTAGMLAPGNPANFNVLDGDRVVETWTGGVRSLVRP